MALQDLVNEVQRAVTIAQAAVNKLNAETKENADLHVQIADLTKQLAGIPALQAQVADLTKQNTDLQASIDAQTAALKAADDSVSTVLVTADPQPSNAMSNT
jgi:cell shape-determining protein MreC